MKPNVIFFIGFALVLTTSPLAWGGNWEITSDENLTLTQQSYSDNWAGTEAGSISWVLSSHSTAASRLSDKLHLKSTMKLEYGQTHSQDAETRAWARPVNSSDLIDFETVLRLTLDWLVDPYVSGRFESAFTDERDPTETRFLNPIRLTESVGVARTIIEDEKRIWSMRFGGAVRQSIDTAVLNADTDEYETYTVTDSGAEFVTEFFTPLAEERLTFTSRFSVFAALHNSESDTFENDDWKSPDMEWDNTFTAGITDFLTVNLSLDALYDREVDPDPRFRQTLSLGLTYRLM